MTRTEQAVKVTVYIPCRNYGKFLGQAVESVLAQIFDDWELFLIDEASSDSTLDIMRGYQIQNADRIKVICNREPLGLQKVANCVLGHARGQYILRLDADDWLDQHALLVMVAYLEFFHDIGMVFGDYYVVDADGKRIAVEQATNVSTILPAGHRPPHGAVTLVRVRDLKRVGGYSEQVSAQDGWDLWYKLSSKVKAKRVPFPVFYYRQHNKSLSRDEQRLYRARSKIINSYADILTGFSLRILAVIGAKESYSHTEGVPFKQVGGKSLLESVLVELTSVKAISAITVSSDSDAVLAFSQSLQELESVPAHHLRRRSFNVPETIFPLAEILQDAFSSFCEHADYRPDVVLFCGIHSSSVTRENIETCINVLKTSGSDSVVSVCEERDMLFKAAETGVEILNPGRVLGVTHAHERLFRFNGGLIAVWADQLHRDNILGDEISYIEVKAHADRHFDFDKGYKL